MSIEAVQYIEAVTEYWRSLFPYEVVFGLFHASQSRGFREFMIWRAKSKSDPANVYPKRFLCFDSAEQFRDYVHEVCLRPGANPMMRIDIGPIYDIRPMKQGPQIAIANTMKFDFDAKDFPRRCTCHEKCCCKECFALVVDAVETLMMALHDELDHKALVPVFSGGRGCHVWVFGVEFHASERYRLAVSRTLQRKYNLPIDAEVTERYFHSLKSPFSVHPSTGMLCMPYTLDELKDPDFLDKALTVFTATREEIAWRANMVKTAITDNLRKMGVWE